MWKKKVSLLLLWHRSETLIENKSLDLPWFYIRLAKCRLVKVHTKVALVAILSSWIQTFSLPTVIMPSLIRFNKILPSSLTFPTWPTRLLPIGFADYNLYAFLISPMRATCSPISLNPQLCPQTKLHTCNISDVSLQSKKVKLTWH